MSRKPAMRLGEHLDKQKLLDNFSYLLHKPLTDYCNKLNQNITCYVFRDINLSFLFFYFYYRDKALCFQLDEFTYVTSIIDEQWLNDFLKKQQQQLIKHHEL